MPTRLGTAIVLACFGFKPRAVSIMKCLSRSTSKYVQENEAILDQFWVSIVPLIFSDDYLGCRPGPGIKWLRGVGIEKNFPSLETSHVLADYRLKTIKLSLGATSASIRLVMSDGTASPLLCGECEPDVQYVIPAAKRVATVRCFAITYIHPRRFIRRVVLLDSMDVAICTFGDVTNKDELLGDCIVPVNETLIGLRIVS